MLSFIRWNKVLRPGLHKGPWTEEEDSIVKECVELSGAQKVCKRWINASTWYHPGDESIWRRANGLWCIDL